MKRGSRNAIFSRGLIRERGRMNQSETRYANWLSADPEVAEFWFEQVYFRITDPEQGRGVIVTPDFLVLMKDGRTFLDDVKPARTEDAASLVRLKVAADKFTLWRFRIVRPLSAREGGGYSIRNL